MRDQSLAQTSTPLIRTSAGRLRRTPLLGLGALVTVATVSGAPASAHSDRYEVRSLQAISAPSPFPQGCPGALLDETHIAGAEIEPSITVNPANPRNIIATWQQDLGFAARTDMIGTSRDGGRTWSRVTIRGLTRCTGGTADAASDPWVSAGPDGTVYFTGLPGSLASDPPAVALVASSSTDGGRHWSDLATVSPADPRVDKAAVTADPARPGYAYVVWADRDPLFDFPLQNTFRFSRTADGGATWSPPVIVDRAPPNGVDQSGEIVVLPHGRLLAIFSRPQILDDGSVMSTLLAARSADGGRTWSRPVEIADGPIELFVDPESGQELSDDQDMVIHSAAGAADGTVYVTWGHNTSPTAGGIFVSRSTDGGRTWAGPSRLPGVRAFAFEPAVAVDAQGTVGVLWYDNRRDRPGDRVRTTDVWFASSRDGGTSWRQTHVAGSFDIRTAPLGRLGEYQGLAAITGQGFAAAFTMAAPQARNGPSDIFFARIQPRRR